MKTLLFCAAGTMARAGVLAGWSEPEPQAVSPVAFGLVLLLGYWAIVLSFLYIRAVLRLTGQATKPIPSLAVIELELRRAGCNPSIADYAAVHQHLTSQRNESLLVAGALIIGYQLLARQA